MKAWTITALQSDSQLEQVAEGVFDFDIRAAEALGFIQDPAHIMMLAINGSGRRNGQCGADSTPGQAQRVVGQRSRGGRSLPRAGNGAGLARGAVCLGSDARMRKCLATDG